MSEMIALETQMLEDGWYVKGSRLKEFEQGMRDLEKTKAELQKAQRLIALLRAENQVLKDEKSRFISTVDACKHHISISGNLAKKYAVCLVKSQLEKARLI